MSKEEFNKLWKDSTKEQILNQYYYDYEEMIKSHNTIKEVREYIEIILEIALDQDSENVNLIDRLKGILEILDKENE